MSWRVNKQNVSLAFMAKCQIHLLHWVQEAEWKSSSGELSCCCSNWHNTFLQNSKMHCGCSLEESLTKMVKNSKCIHIKCKSHWQLLHQPDGRLAIIPLRLGLSSNWCIGSMSALSDSAGFCIAAKQTLAGCRGKHMLYQRPLIKVWSNMWGKHKQQECNVQILS